MSQYEELKTTMTDQQYLVDALTEMGFKRSTNGRTALKGYGGVTWSRPVQVIIPREQLRGALAPVGFGRDETGVFQAVIDDLDRQYGGLDASWLGRLAQGYKERQTMAMAKTKGYIFRGREVVQTPQGPKVQLRFAVR
ncbi:MAG: DUF1257 domain-containing protein [Bryobacteraceae bacterium]